ncbi:MAG: PQ-loop domain-containing transporter [Planctomycetia bacterium]|nr:PQ-loop domain-containing transporter [Planctomycetia bacterium]
MSLFEAGMMICFGASWPMSLWKLWRTKQTGGMSLRFLTLVAVGYLCGIIHKVWNNLDWVMWLYVVNLGMVTAAILLVIRYRWGAGERKG